MMLKNITRGIYPLLAINVESFPVAFKAEIALLSLGRHSARFTSGNRETILGSKSNRVIQEQCRHNSVYNERYGENAVEEPSSVRPQVG
jgi:hypothetical protein